MPSSRRILILLLSRDVLVIARGCSFYDSGLLDALENVVFLPILAGDLADDLPFVAVGNVDAAVGIVLHADFLADARLFDFAGVAGRPGVLGDAERVHRSIFVGRARLLVK